jgi:hypothetical protein
MAGQRGKGWAAGQNRIESTLIVHFPVGWIAHDPANDSPHRGRFARWLGNAAGATELVQVFQRDLLVASVAACCDLAEQPGGVGVALVPVPFRNSSLLVRRRICTL